MGPFRARPSDSPGPGSVSLLLHLPLATPWSLPPPQLPTLFSTFSASWLPPYPVSPFSPTELHPLSLSLLLPLPLSLSAPRFPFVPSGVLPSPQQHKLGSLSSLQLQCGFGPHAWPLGLSPVCFPDALDKFLSL